MLRGVTSKVQAIVAGQGFFARAFSQSAVLAKDNPEWKAMKVTYTQTKRETWRSRRKMNPFVTNVGVANQMKALDMDVQDPELSNLHLRSDANPDYHMEEVFERTQRWDKNVHRKPEDFISKQRLASILTKKNFFPNDETPLMVTWMERQIIEHLHKSDPGHWTPEKLSESFPATPKMIKRVLKLNKKPMHPENIQKYDAKVKELWKKYAQGELKVDAEFKEILDNQCDVETRLNALFKSEDRFKIEQDIIESYKKSLEFPKIKPGKFANIVIQYNEKVETKKMANAIVDKVQSRASKLIDETNCDKDITSKELFSDKTEVSPDFEGPSVYRDTALLNSGVDIRKEKPMTLNEFREKHLDKSYFTDMIDEGEVGEENRVKITYLKWLRKQRNKDAKVTKVKKLSANAILEEERQSVRRK